MNEKYCNELVESFINGNRGFVLDKLMKCQKKSIIKFFYYLEINRDWIGSKVVMDITNRLHNRAF